MAAHAYDDIPAIYSRSSRVPPSWRDRIDVDTKYTRINPSMIPVISTASITHLNVITRGTGTFQRMGDSCRLTSIQMIAKVSSKTSTNANMCVGYWVWDYEPDGNLPAITDILEYDSVFSHPNRDNMTRFLIIPMFNVTFPFAAGVGTSAKGIAHTWPLPQDAFTRYTRTDTTGVLANIVRGALYMVLLGEDPAGATQGEFLGRIRVNFEDYRH